MNKKASVLLIVLLTVSFLISTVPAVPTDIGSLGITTTQNINYQATSTLTPYAPFAMIVMNDPQIFWQWDDIPEAMDEQLHKRAAIFHIWTNDPKYRYFLNYDPVAWPKSTGSNLLFDQSQLNSPIPQVKGVIINGDLTYGQPADGIVYDCVCTHDCMHAADRPPMSDEWWYRYYYVSQDSDFGVMQFPGLAVYAGIGNHDSKWTILDLGHALLLDKDYPLDVNKRRFWTNFPTPDVAKYNVHWDTETRKGSLSYSWNINNYHFVQLNCYCSLPREENVYPKWLGGGVLKSGEIEITSVDLEWFKDDLAKAKAENKRIVVNMHYPFGSGWDDVGKLFSGTNVVALFIGHTRPFTGMIPPADLDALPNYRNAFGQSIPVFQAGHSGNFFDWNGYYWWGNDHQLLVIKCADWYMNVGLAGCGTWGGPGGLPYWIDPTDDKKMVTLKFDTQAPQIANATRIPDIVYPGCEAVVQAIVQDAESGVKQVLLNCTFTNSTHTWNKVVSMHEVVPSPAIWEATIPGCPCGTKVTYAIVVEDNLGNTITSEDQYGYLYEYEVVPEFSSFLIMPIFMGATLLTVAIIRRKRKANPLTYTRLNQPL